MATQMEVKPVFNFTLLLERSKCMHVNDEKTRNKCLPPHNHRFAICEQTSENDQRDNRIELTVVLKVLLDNGNINKGVLVVSLGALVWRHGR